MSIIVEVVWNATIFGKESRTKFVEDERNGSLVRLRPDHYGALAGGPWMPVESVPHFVNDCAGRVEGPPSDHPLISEVLAGRAELLGKGNDGIVFRVGAFVVKVSTTVPYQPMNPGHRTPREACLMLQCQALNVNALHARGVPGLQFSEFVEHGDKGYQIKPWVEIPEVWTASQLDEIEDAIRALHRYGFALYDYVQAGIEPGGRVVLFDVGNLRFVPEPSRKPRFMDPRNDDFDALNRLRLKSGAPIKDFGYPEVQTFALSA